jgi:pathogenesis-related protein 1
MLTSLSSRISTVLVLNLCLAPLAPRARAQETLTVRAANTAVLEGAERERFVMAHNAARKAVGLEPVTWSDELAAYALEGLVKQQEALITEAKEGWKEGTLALPEHRQDLKLGENIAGWMGVGNLQGAERAVVMWMREKAAFDRLNAVKPYRVGDEIQEPGIRDHEPGDRKQEPGKEKKQPEGKSEEQKEPIVVGHYTQIVWRETKQIGAAKLSFELVDEKGRARSYVGIICNYDPPGNRRGEKPF